MNSSFRILSIVAAAGLAAGSPAFASAPKAHATKAKAAKAAKPNPLTESFRGWDSNNDGAITQAELVKSGMSKKTDAKIAKAFKTADRNHDGKITAGEYTRSVSHRLGALERKA